MLSMLKSMSVVALLLGSLAGPVQAMQALDDQELQGVTGAGLAFFGDNLSYSQSIANGGSAQILGVKNSKGESVQMDINELYIKGAGSKRGTLDTKVTLGTPMHPFTLGPIKYKSGDNIPVGGQALQLMTPTWTDPINDTHQFGLWSYYQGCLYGQAGCTDANAAVNKVTAEINGLVATRTSIINTYGDIAALRTGVNADMVNVNQKQAVVSAKEPIARNDYNAMSNNYSALPNELCYWFTGCGPKPKNLGEKWSCGANATCSGDPRVQKYNASVDTYGKSSGELDVARREYSQAWEVKRNGKDLSTRATDIDKFSQLCGDTATNASNCTGGSIAKTQNDKGVVQLVAGAMTSGGKRVIGMDIGLKTKFTLRSTPYDAQGKAGATVDRTDYFSMYLENFTLHGSYLNVWGDSKGMQMTQSLQMYADKMIVSGCDNNPSCTDANRSVLTNVYFDLNLGNAQYQPISLGALSNGELTLKAPGVTWANHDAFYQNVAKSNINIGNMNLAGTNIGTQSIRGMRVDYLEMNTVSLPRR